MAAWCQNRPADHPNVPIYSVTVVERTVKAVDYQYRGGPTGIDFRGTVLLPKAKGDAMVESKAGRTEIDARFDHVEAPTRFGPEYLTYVLWAITPEGHAKNLGEILPGSSDHAKMHVTTDLQAFGLIVTAEPYSAVRQPSDVVVIENEVRPETVGRIEPIQARYELLPRGSYTYNVPSDLKPAVEGEKVSMDQYESLLEVYQAQNAVQIARAAGADKYAAETFSKAERLLRDAQNYQIRRADRSTVVTVARQAAQTAEDARTITATRKRDEELALARDQVAHEQQLRMQAEAEAQRVRSQVSADRLQVEEARSARDRAEVEAAAAQTAAAQTAAAQAAAAQAAAAAAAPPPPPPPQMSAAVPTRVQIEAQSEAREGVQRHDLRVDLVRQLNSVMPTLDTPRGLVVTVPDHDFRGTNLSPAVFNGLARVAAIIAGYPGLYVQVDGHTDAAGNPSREEQFSYERAVAVRDALGRGGLPRNTVSARGLGGSRALGPNDTAAGREQNRRVEITIAGDPIGSTPNWDKPYTVTPLR